MNESFNDKVEFEIIGKIADGGMGAVYKAHQKGVHGFAKTVAIKTILPELADNREFVDEFISEAMLVANLIHENIVQIYQLGKTHREYYFVLEFVDGISLYDFMTFHERFKTRLPVQLGVFIAARIARGLAYAHTRMDAEGKPMNIVHCDVCPHNILINCEGVPKLTDFGIARASVRKLDRGISGKLPFVSPEQTHTETVLDFRSDIYSLGVVLFFMLAGKLPRAIDKPMREMVADIRGNCIDWSLLPTEVDGDLRSILQRMMALSVNDRFQSTADLARELEYYIYKDGYGPTIVTLSNYMRKVLPGLFDNESGVSSQSSAASSGDSTMLDKTTRLDVNLEKTMRLSEGEA